MIIKYILIVIITNNGLNISLYAAWLLIYIINRL